MELQLKTCLLMFINKQVHTPTPTLKCTLITLIETIQIALCFIVFDKDKENGQHSKIHNN